MPDEPLYDPGRMVPEDLDFTDPDVARAYLDNPVTEKLHDDFRRSFRSMPPAQQQAELNDYLSGLEQKRIEVAAAIERDRTCYRCDPENIGVQTVAVARAPGRLWDWLLLEPDAAVSGTVVVGLPPTAPYRATVDSMTGPVGGPGLRCGNRSQSGEQI